MSQAAAAAAAAADSSRCHVTLQLVKSGLESASAHGIGRVVTSKRIHVKAVWLLAFLACCSIFGHYLIKFIDKLSNPITISSLYASNTEFEYPDIFICFDNPLSGSRFLFTNESVRDSVTRIFNQVDNAYKKMCNSTPKPVLCNYQSYFHYPSKVNSIPFHLLADVLGRRVNDLVLSSALVQSIGVSIMFKVYNVTEFYHPSHVRCLKIVYNEEQRKILKSSGTAGGILLTLMYDTFSTGLYNYFNGSKFPTISDHENFQILPPHWMLAVDQALILKRISSARFYFVPRGEYPSSDTENILLSPGHYHTIKIGMQDFSYQKDQFKHLCLESHPAVEFVNPYTNEAESFNYSVSHCYYSFVQQLMMNYMNSMISYMPQPAPILTNNNYFDVSNNAIFNVSQETNDEMLRLPSPNEACSNKALCRTRKYSVDVSSTDWPEPSDFEELIRLIQTKGVEDSPAHQYGCHVLNDSNKLDEAKEFAAKNFVKIRLVQKSGKGDLLKFSLNYGIENFMADVGGIMGIYLGASILTLGEIFEIVWTIFAANFELRKKTRVTKVDNSEMQDAESQK